VKKQHLQKVVQTQTVGRVLAFYYRQLVILLGLLSREVQFSVKNVHLLKF
jgi:hypothetical protein